MRVKRYATKHRDEINKKRRDKRQELKELAKEVVVLPEVIVVKKKRNKKVEETLPSIDDLTLRFDDWQPTV